MAEKKGSTALLIGVLAIAVIGVAILVNAMSKAPPAEKFAAMGTKTSTEGARYVGAKECIECHQEKHAGWLGTMHPYKVQDISRDVIKGDFWVNNTYERDDITITMKERDGRFFINTVNIDGQYQDFELKYTLGGEWKQRYLTELPDGGLHVLPLQVNIATGKWANYIDATPGKSNYWMNRNRLFQTGCGDCHVTGMDIGYNKQTDTFKTTWVDNGVACEACHGPGSNHIEAAPGYESRTIINPARLPQTKAQSDVCARCHVRGSSTALIAETHGIRGAAKTFSYPYGYQIGHNIEDYYVSVSPETHTPQRFWPSGHAKSHHQQWEEWMVSTHRAAGVSCLDCHQGLHGESGTRRLTKEPGNKLCLSCHNEPNRNNFGIHAIHASGSCVECHMPRTARTATNLTKYGGDIKSHLFKFLYPQATIDAGGLDKQMNTCNACHYHEDDKPEDLQRAINKIRDERRKTFGLK